MSPRILRTGAIAQDNGACAVAASPWSGQGRAGEHTRAPLREQ
jgi:hypothetical protein